MLILKGHSFDVGNKGTNVSYKTEGVGNSITLKEKVQKVTAERTIKSPAK